MLLLQGDQAVLAIQHGAVTHHIPGEHALHLITGILFQLRVVVMGILVLFVGHAFGVTFGKAILAHQRVIYVPLKLMRSNLIISFETTLSRLA